MFLFGFQFGKKEMVLFFRLFVCLFISCLLHYPFRYAYLDETGIFDEKTKQKMKEPRCGMADIVTPEVQSTRKRRFTPQGTKWLNRV